MTWKLFASLVENARPRIPVGKRIYAVSDVHGCADLLAALLARIDSDLKTHPIAEPIQVFLGDYIDRGPQSRQVLDLLIARQRQHRMQFLKGNHEAYASEVLSDPSMLSEWMEMGAIPTLLSYGVNLFSRGAAQSQREIAMAFRRALPDSHHEFLMDLAPSFSCGDFFFVHAGVRPGIPLAQQRQDDLLWIREEFLLHEDDFGKVVVHGHTPAHEPDVRANRINIDTGAYATGRLTCLILEDDKMRFL